MAKKITDKEKASLEKDAQKLLTQSKKLLIEAGKLAEKGQFELSYMDHVYLPKSIFGEEYDSWENMDYSEKATRLGLVKSASEWDKLSEDQRTELSDDIDENNYKEEYAQPGEFWQASHC